MSRVVLVDHPLIQHKLSLLRDKETNIKEFRELTEEISMMLGYEATRDIPLKSVEIETPIGDAKTQVIAGQKIGLVPILRAGLGMVGGLQRLVPSARVGHIGLYREPEMLESVEYFSKLPTDVEDRDLYVMDVMMATGGNAIAAVNILKNNHVSNIKMLCIIAAPEGIAEMQRVHEDVDIYVACIDERLNESGYIVPGLGDAGDRLFGTK